MAQLHAGVRSCASPSSEMVTLEEFLEESNRGSPTPVSGSGACSPSVCPQMGQDHRQQRRTGGGDTAWCPAGLDGAHSHQPATPYAGSRPRPQRVLSASVK